MFIGFFLVFYFIGGKKAASGLLFFLNFIEGGAFYARMAQIGYIFIITAILIQGIVIFLT